MTCVRISGSRFLRSLIVAVTVIVSSGAALADPDDHGALGQAPASGTLLKNLRPTAGDMALHPSAGAFEVRTSVVPSGTLNVGPMVTVSPTRNGISDSEIDPLSQVDPAWEAGAFVDYRMDNGTKPSTVVGLNLRMAPGISDDRGGWLFLPNVYYQAPLGDSWNIRADLSSTFATDNAGAAGFGGSSATKRGIDGFDGDGGFKDVGVGVGVTYNLTPSWDVDTALRYQRLLDETSENAGANDPGAVNQLFGGVLVRYKF